MRTRTIASSLGALLCSLAVAVGAPGCGDDEGIDSDEEARRAYLGLDTSIGKSLGLGFDGFNSASSANISPQSAPGDLTGTLTITGQVDQGSSANKGMRLRVGMVDYSDGHVVIEEDDVDIDLTYDTSEVAEEQPYLVLSLRDIPSGTFTGTLDGTYHMSGDLEGDALLDLDMSGTIHDDGTGKVVRQPGTTTVTGTASTGDGTYEVALTL